jgi:hypothetical protein
VNLSPKAKVKVCRMAADLAFDKAAKHLNLDWDSSYDGKQIQLWAEACGGVLVEQRGKDLAAFARGEMPPCKAGETELLVIGMDGGRVQTREKSGETGSRWKENKVLTITSCLKGDGQEIPPKKLLTTYLATMEDAHAFSPMTRFEAEKRGLRNARQVIGIHDGGNWIDPIWDQHFACHKRILDYYHANEHLHDVAKAAQPENEANKKQLADELVALLWDGKIEALLTKLRDLSTAAGPPLATDVDTHPRKILSQNVGYFERHKDQIDYPTYRKNGWPIGSGITESGVKQFGKRVKGTEQFWNVKGAEAILALRNKWLSEDEASQHYWLGYSSGKQAA